MSTYMDIDQGGYVIPRVIPFRLPARNSTRSTRSGRRSTGRTPIRTSVIRRTNRTRIKRRMLQVGGRRKKIFKQKRKDYIDRLLRSVGVGNKTATYNCYTASDVVTNSLNNRNYNLLENDNGLGCGLFNKDRFDRIFTQAVGNGLGDDVNTKLVITYQDSVLRLKNQSDIQADVTVYLLKVRKSIPDEQTLQTIISAGFVQIGGGNSSNQPLSIKLWMNEMFNQYFEIVRKEHKYLDPTAERQFVAKSKKVFTKSKQYQSTVSYTEMRGAYLWMISVNGSLVHDTTTASIVNVGKVTLDVNITETTNFYIGTTRSTTLSASADTDTTVAAGEAFVLEDIGESAVENPAI